MIEYDEGIHLKNTDIWFDAKKGAKFSFISHANLGHLAPHDKVIATPETLKLCEGKLKNSVTLACPYGRQFSLGKAQVELIPAGYILGSAQIVVEINGSRIIYTGEFKLGGSKTIEPGEAKRCDILVMRCTYGLPKYVFPNADEVVENLCAFVEKFLSRGITPVLLANPLGESQEVVKILGDMGYRLSLHSSIFRIVKIYEDFGVSFSNYDRYRSKKIEGSILIVPPYARGGQVVEGIEEKRIAVLTGWALEKEFVKSVFGADEAFPISNCADFKELIAYVGFAKPREVYLVGRFSAEFARVLKKRGFNAKPLERPSQLRLI